MPWREDPLWRRQAKASAGATNEELEIGPVPQGQIWRVSHVAWEDETSAYTSARLYLREGNQYHWLTEAIDPAAAQLWWDEHGYQLAEGMRLGVRFVGTTSGDALRLYLSGSTRDIARPGQQE